MTACKTMNAPEMKNVPAIAASAANVRIRLRDRTGTMTCVGSGMFETEGGGMSFGCGPALIVVPYRVVAELIKLGLGAKMYTRSETTGLRRTDSKTSAIIAEG